MARLSKTIHPQPILDQYSLQKILDYFLKKRNKGEFAAVALLLGITSVRA